MLDCKVSIVASQSDVYPVLFRAHITIPCCLVGLLPLSTAHLGSKRMFLPVEKDGAAATDDGTITTTSSSSRRRRRRSSSSRTND